MICVQTPVLPLTAHESFSHVSLPNSPGRGMVLNVHSSLPVRTSNARTRPLVLLWVADRRAFAERRADDDHVLDDGRRRVHADLAGLEIDRLAVAVDGADLQVDDAVRCRTSVIIAPVFALSATSR